MEKVKGEKSEAGRQCLARYVHRKRIEENLGSLSGPAVQAESPPLAPNFRVSLDLPSNLQYASPRAFVIHLRGLIAR